MTNETVLERTSNLVMPSHYVELDEEEMSYTDGGAWYHWLISGGIGAACAVGITLATGGTGAVAGATLGIKIAKWLGIAAIGAIGGCGSYGVGLIP